MRWRSEFLFQLVHGPGESSFEVEAVAVGEHEDGPEAIGEFVGESGVDVLGRAQALLGRGEFHQVADIAGEPLGEFSGCPRAAAVTQGLLIVERADLQGTGREGGK